MSVHNADMAGVRLREMGGDDKRVLLHQRIEQPPSGGDAKRNVVARSGVQFGVQQLKRMMERIAWHRLKALLP